MIAFSDSSSRYLSYAIKSAIYMYICTCTGRKSNTVNTPVAEREGHMHCTVYWGLGGTTRKCSTHLEGIRIYNCTVWNHWRWGPATTCINCRNRILCPWLGDIVDSGIGLSYRPAGLCSLAGGHDNHILQSRTKNLATGRKAGNSLVVMGL